MSELCIVACGARKIWDKNPYYGSVPARDAYIGPLTRAAIQYAERFYPNSWVIISAKYGFLLPNERIQNYNVTFLDPSTNPISVDELRKQAHDKNLDTFDTYVVLGGSTYAKIISMVFGADKVRAPLLTAGGIGRMIQRLTRAVARGEKL